MTSINELMTIYLLQCDIPFIGNSLIALQLFRYDENSKCQTNFVFSLFLVNVLISYLLKTPENFWFSGFFMKYKMAKLARKGLSIFKSQSHYGMVWSHKKCTVSQCTIYSDNKPYFQCLASLCQQMAICGFRDRCPNISRKLSI